MLCKLWYWFCHKVFDSPAAEAVQILNFNLFQVAAENEHELQVDLVKVDRNTVELHKRLHECERQIDRMLMRRFSDYAFTPVYSERSILKREEQERLRKALEARRN